jgi:ferredoxin
VDVVSSAFRVVVDRELCEGNARCVRLAPSVFEVGDDDKLKVLIERPDAVLRESVEAAVALCPRQALAIADD